MRRHAINAAAGCAHTPAARRRRRTRLLLAQSPAHEPTHGTTAHPSSLIHTRNYSGFCVGRQRESTHTRESRARLAKQSAALGGPARRHRRRSGMDKNKANVSKDIILSYGCAALCALRAWREICLSLFFVSHARPRRTASGCEGKTDRIVGHTLPAPDRSDRREGGWSLRRGAAKAMRAHRMLAVCLVTARRAHCPGPSAPGASTGALLRALSTAAPLLPSRRRAW